MPPTFSPNDALLEKRIADSALTQLRLRAMYPRVAMTDYEDRAFNFGDVVTFRRAKRRRAQELDPRTGTLSFAEAEFASGELKLEKLFGDPIISYGHDSRQTMEKYMIETGEMIADAIATPNDEYMYSNFRTWNIASSGVVKLAAHPPIAISACVDFATGQLAKFNSNGLTGADTFLSQENVPGSNRFCVMSSSAKGAFLGDAVVVTGFAAASIGSGQLIQRGLQVGEFVERYGFMAAGSNVVGGQSAVADLDTAASAQATLPIGSIAANTDFQYADHTTLTYLGAVNFTLTVGTALQNVAVGQIARIGTSSRATAFGVVLRVASNVVTLVPYSPEGIKLLPGDITPGTDVFSIPRIPSINTVNHREALAMATRMVRQPSPGSGAVAATVTDPDTNLTIQVFTGNFDVGNLTEKRAAYMLTGSKVTDFRKCGFILSL